MKTHVPSKLLFTFTTLVVTAVASTIFHCTPAPPGVVEVDCFKSCTNDVNGATGCDGNAYIDTAGHSSAYNNVATSIRSSGAAAIVPAVKLLSTCHRLCATSAFGTWSYTENKIYGTYMPRSSQKVLNTTSDLAASPAANPPICRNRFTLTFFQCSIRMVYLAFGFTQDVYYGFVENTSTYAVFGNIISDISKNAANKSNYVIAQVGVSTSLTVVKTITLTLSPGVANWDQAMSRLGYDYNNLRTALEKALTHMTNSDLTEGVLSFPFSDNTVAFIASLTVGKTENANISTN